jgi:hypothetical protein
MAFRTGKGARMLRRQRGGIKRLRPSRRFFAAFVERAATTFA